MPTLALVLDLERVGSSYLLLGTFVALGVLAVALFYTGGLNVVLGLVRLVVQGAIRTGFRLWARLLSWATWPLFFALVVAVLGLGLWGTRVAPPLALACGAALLFLGVTTCLAYMFIDLERYEVARGYKALHNPLKGQE